MAIRTDYSDPSNVTYYLAGTISGGTLIRYTILGVDYTTSIVTTDTVAILALLNSLNIGTWTLVSGTYYCYNATVALFGYRIDTGAGTNDATMIGVANDYLRDYQISAMATELETVTARIPTQTATLNYGVCPCSCDFDELAFAGETESNLYTSDQKSYLFKKFATGDTYSLKLYKNGSVTGIDIDTTIADVWGFGDVKRNGVVDSDYSGFLIYWYRVFVLHGYGDYIIKGTQTINGVAIAYESHTFMVRAFNYNLAQGTVKIECVQNGYIESEDIDWTGINWYQSVRVRGKLTKGVPKLAQDNYLNSARNVTQIQDQIIDNYDLELRPLPASIANFIAYNNALANTMLVSDFNVNPEIYNQLDLVITEISEFKSWSQSLNIKGVFKLTDRVQDKIKRNYR